jgi:hypothetical protein
MVQIAANHTMLAAITPATNPESEDAVYQPILNRDSPTSREIKSLKIFFILLFNYNISYISPTSQIISARFGPYSY